jgi:Asp-tRNA(Asn)/Glu-tRNA(Gln) amidotransferase A subunit family amidase
MAKDLWRWGAVELASAIRSREISSREAVESCLARIDAVNPRVNAIVDLMADEALRAADKADAAVKKDGVLHGVPVTLKINVDLAGRPTTNGVVAFKDKVPGEESPCVIQWRNAGAIFVGRTNVPAFSTRYFTDNALHGRTLNPWRLRPAAHARAHRHLRAGRAGDARHRHAAREHARTPRALGTRPAPWHGGDDGTRCARSVVGAGAARE